jgi:8-oxo-dGTP pyrophosphatase MutT (NUDIX family)
MVGASYTRLVLTRIEPASSDFGPDAIRRRLAERPPVETLLTADDIEKQREAAANPALTQAAVLLLVVNRPEGAAVVFTQRTADLADHAGQISFPGGRKHPEDADAIATALREAQEEVGLDPARVDVIGELPDYHTSTGYRVRPIVGWAEPPVVFTPDPREVADVFEVPLAFLLDEANHRHESAYYRGRLRKYWAMPWRGRFIWGATAGMLVTFQRIVGQR